MIDAILALNAGSSSLKVSVFTAERAPRLLARGQIDGIGARPRFLWEGSAARELAADLTAAGAVREFLMWLTQRDESWRVRAVGHRIVHGGEKFVAPTVLTPAILQELDELIPLARLHQPVNLSAVRAAMEFSPEALQVGCFDTAFHADKDPIFQRFPLPRAWFDQGVRRYGFHGLSYEWIARVLATDHPQMAAGKTVAAHLGNGSSLCAMQAGRSVDTTMGMTALDGLPMGTRCGSMDPGVLLYMLREQGYSADRVEGILTRESGLLGLSGISQDVRALLASDRPEAKFALEYFAVAAAQNIARMAVSLGGMETLVFTGGIGEHAGPVRERILGRLEFLRPFSVLVISANEEQMIAEHCASKLAGP